MNLIRISPRIDRWPDREMSGIRCFGENQFQARQERAESAESIGADPHQ